MGEVGGALNAIDSEMGGRISTYVVHGAKTWCEHSTREARLVALKSHGITLKGTAQLRADDSIGGVNINSMGVCLAPKIEEVAPKKSFWKTITETIIKIFTKPTRDVTIPVTCTPETCGLWLETKSDVHIGDLVESDNNKALLSTSYIFCQKGGKIIITNDGQADAMERAAASLEKEPESTSVADDGISSLKNGDFVKINNPKNGIDYFGGNQGWWTDEQWQAGGCGPTSAANILAYMAIQDPKYAALYGYDVNNINVDDFVKHMDDVIDVLTPIHAPKPLGDVVRNISSDFYELTIGVPTLSMYKNAVIEYANDRGVELNANVYDGTNYAVSKNVDLIIDGITSATPSSADEFREVEKQRQEIIDQYTTKELEEIKAFIKLGLDNDRPIAMLNWINNDISSVPYTSASGNHANASMEYHWVTITRMEEDLNTGEITVEVSTWGGKAIMNLEDIAKSDGFGGLIYFD